MSEICKQLWVDKYRPKKLSDYILNDKMKQKFKDMIKNNAMQSMTFIQCPGSGKTTLAKILCNEFGINCALVSGTGMTSDTSGGPHMWCYVQLNGNWYALDATWDDGYTDSDGHPCPMYNYFLVGSGTWVTNQKQFSKNHINDGQVMSSEMKHPLVFPSLSPSMYDHYIRDADPIEWTVYRIAPLH